MSHFRQVPAALALAVTATIGIANAQTTIITREPVQTQTVVTTSQPLSLTPVQRQRIYTTVTRQRVTPAQATVRYQVGMRVPQTVELHALPPEVLVDVPVVKDYRYMVVNDRIWLVDPATSEVIAEVVN